VTDRLLRAVPRWDTAERMAMAGQSQGDTTERVALRDQIQ
jgi:hypothetical protein